MPPMERPQNGIARSECIENAERVGDEQVERIVALRGGRSAVPPCVVSQYAIAILQRLGQFVPHGQVGRQAVAEHHPGAMAVDPAVKDRSIAFDLHSLIRLHQRHHERLR